MGPILIYLPRHNNQTRLQLVHRLLTTGHWSLVTNHRLTALLARCYTPRVHNRIRVNHRGHPKHGSQGTMGEAGTSPALLRNCNPGPQIRPEESQDTHLCETPNTFARKGVGAMAEAAPALCLPP